ncbi:MAG: hypothetical protein J4452_03620 [Candidatus Aenigmarchaeota archaeon]|nr:hypothetical protein [Candidatus Aenigmarchaeota archaeon]
MRPTHIPIEQLVEYVRYGVIFLWQTNHQENPLTASEVAYAASRYSGVPPLSPETVGQVSLHLEREGLARKEEEGWVYYFKK